MHILFVHSNFPAQFGQIARKLVQDHGFQCTFASTRPGTESAGIRRIQYHPKSGATKHNHFCSRTFENQIWHTSALYEALHAETDLKPDLVVAHSGFVSALFLRQLFDCPVINYFEYFYRVKNSDFDFRQDLPANEPLHAMRAMTRNAMLLLDLENCDAGYSPTRFQRAQLPACFHEKVRVIFDGIDTSIWRPQAAPKRQVAGHSIPQDARVVTYVSRGLESMRGFDIFLRMAKLLCDRRSDIVFVVAGEDRVCYGGDERFTEGKTFKQWLLSRDEYDLSRILFVNHLPVPELVNLFSLSEAHVYLTVPFVLSWSLLNALSCGCTVLGSDTAPVREVIQHGETGLLFDFFDVESLAQQVEQVLDAPADFKQLGVNGRRLIEEQYELEMCLTKMLALYEEVVS